ncbi:pogo transposable element with KRAB domain isoform X2 [Ornithorhynchus anatinus]|uniref:pogo transposable element with KRAB domain isoform X2 n=1 Tax=Ornithorhynchus anatinus TaxID=9258 RepID=UPI0010A79C61|nr:pogo transposable element with KRAB domain isoform X2 [Ornithorhynchus anatinus]
MASPAFPLALTLKEEEEEEEIGVPELEDGQDDLQRVPALFDEVAVSFSDEEWDLLTEEQKTLYREVMKMNYETVVSLEFPFPRPDVISQLEEGEGLWAAPFPADSEEWLFPRGAFPGYDEAGPKLPAAMGPLGPGGPFPALPHPLALGFPSDPRGLGAGGPWGPGGEEDYPPLCPGGAGALLLQQQQQRGVRRSYDAGFKLAVVDYAEVTNNCQAAKQFGVMEKNVRDWRKVKPQLQSAHAMRRAFRGPKNGRFALVDQRVAEYVRQQQAAGTPITREAMQLKALAIAQEMRIPAKGFKASLGWCRRMLRRYDLTLRQKPPPPPQPLPEDLSEKLAAYQRRVLGLRRAHGYPDGQMGNADETPICLEVPSRVTVDYQAGRPVLVKTPGREKLKVTAMLGVLADGRKLPPFVILRGTYIPPGRFPGGMEVRCHRYGWMTEELMQDWVEAVWRRRTPGAGPRERGLLILNGFRGHASDSLRAHMETLSTDVVIAPGGLTSQLQVLDLVVYKPLNDSVRARYADWLLAGNLALSPTGNAKKPPLGLFLEWVMAAWDGIPSDAIVRGFRRCRVSGSLDDRDGADDDLLWEVEGALLDDGDPPPRDGDS